MFRLICWLNVLMSVPFGIVALIAPAFVFGQFGIAVDAAAAGIVRGYAATALGYGVVLFLLRNSVAADVVRAILIGSVVFNGLEVLVQVPLYVQGLATAMIWSTIVGHALLAALSVWELTQSSRR